MVELSSTQKKVLDIYHNEGHVKAWNYWKLIGNAHGIFLGEVPSSEFIDGESLANRIGLTEGVLCNNDTPWLKFILDGNIVVVPMKPLMNSVSWDAINVCGVVFENEGATIVIGGNTYDITLLRGLNYEYDPNARYHGHDINQTHNSEWNRLMYPIHSGGVHTVSTNSSISSAPYTQWASYSDDDLITNYSVGSGSYSWTQETPSNDATRRLVRGYVGVSYVSRLTATSTNMFVGWRPALRLVV